MRMWFVREWIASYIRVTNWYTTPHVSINARADTLVDVTAYQGRAQQLKDLLTQLENCSYRCQL
jgi:hypothetical protein